MAGQTSKRVVRRQRIQRHVRKRIQGTTEKPRLSVYRSLKAIYVQLIDDVENKTLLTVASNSKEMTAEVKSAKSKIEIAKAVGKKIGEEAKNKNIDSIVFDRNGYLYHGRVKAVAEGAREAGLKF